MCSNDLFIEIAKRELANPTHPDVSRLLEVHKLAEKDGHPIITKVEYSEGDKVAHVYFSIQEEPYFLVIKIDSETMAPLDYTCVYIESNYRVYLKLLCYNISSDEITRRLLINPTRTFNKHLYDEVEGKEKECTFWRYEPQPGVPGTLESKIEFLLDKLDNSKCAISELISNGCDGFVEVCYEGYKDWISGFCLSNMMMRRIAELGLHLDIDMYVSGPALPPPD